jgi:hypothetical protein
VLAPRSDVVAGGKFLDHFDIRRQTGTSEDTFEQVVAEQCGIGNTAGERGLESVDFVNALAGVGAFADQILVNVRGGRGVRVDAVHAGKDALEQRTLPADRQ